MGVTTRSSQTPTKPTNSSEEDNEQYKFQKREMNQSSSGGEENSDSEATKSDTDKDSEGDPDYNETTDIVFQNESLNDSSEEGEDNDEKDVSEKVVEAEGDDEEEEEEDESDEEETQDDPKVQPRFSKKVDTTGFYGYKCYFAKLVTEGKEIMDRFDKPTLEILFKTPFGVFFKSIMGGEINSTTMIMSCSHSFFDIIGKFTRKGNGFRFNNKEKVVNLEAVDVALIFGMPLKGHKFEPKGKTKGTAGKFEKKYLSKIKNRVTKTELLKEINTLAAKKKLNDQEREDLVKLFLLYSFAMFFFCSTNGGVSKMMIRKFENLSYVNKCSWPSIIHSYLMNSMREHFTKPTSISGCVYILLYFVLEHCEIMDSIKGSESASPRMLKWNLSRVTGENWVRCYNRMETTKVKGTLDDLSDAEKALVSETEDLNENEDTYLVEGSDAVVRQQTTNFGKDTTFLNALAVAAHNSQLEEDVERDDGSQTPKDTDLLSSVLKTPIKRKKEEKGKGKDVENIRQSDTVDDVDVEEDQTQYQFKETGGSFQDDEQNDPNFNQQDEDTEELPDNVDMLKYLLNRLKRNYNLQELKLKRLEEAEGENKNIYEIDNESDRFKA